MIILVDTREQLPYWSGREAARIGLCVGDYTTTTLFNQIHIERKSAGDWYGTLSKNFRRFRNEIVRARDRRIRLVILVEIPEKKFYLKQFPRGDKLLRSGDSLKAQVKTLRRKYGLEIVWVKNREIAKQKCHALLKTFSKGK